MNNVYESNFWVTTMKAMKISSLTWRSFFLSQFISFQILLSHKKKCSLQWMINSCRVLKQKRNGQQLKRLMLKCLRNALNLKWDRLCLFKTKSLFQKSLLQNVTPSKPITSFLATQKRPHHEVNITTKDNF